MKSHEEEIETQIGCRKTYIPPLVSFDVMEKGCILATSVRGEGSESGSGEGDYDPDPPRGGRGINVQSISIDPITEDDYSLGVDNY